MTLKAKLQNQAGSDLKTGLNAETQHTHLPRGWSAVALVHYRAVKAQRMTSETCTCQVPESPLKPLLGWIQSHQVPLTTATLF